MKNETTQTPEVTAVLENQQGIVGTKAVITTLENAISKCQSQIMQQEAALPDVGPLLSRRADLLADMVIGEDTRADIKKLDIKLEKLNAQRKDAAPALDVLQQTVEGLSRRLLEAREKLQSLQMQRSGLMGQLLHSRAEAIGAEYFESAEKMVAKYKQLRALDNLMQGSLLEIYSKGLNVPRFSLKSVPPLMIDVWSELEVFTSDFLTPKKIEEFKDQEIAALLGMGIMVDIDAINFPI
ncbi:hypothetical protein [Rhodoferax sp.]|uniref:hypothetical protein n=1 Tax=Rhodoferax sp. TaxID=50421 RepID=UPI00261E6167|nr:hypothetical protein [Rhodoferax sp.]MDD5478747.1 hypothetical protein [Rhodoferax sp.]